MLINLLRLLPPETAHELTIGLLRSNLVLKRKHTKLFKSLKQTILGINFKDKPEAARNWLNELGDPFEKIVADKDGRTAIDWGVYGVPETYLVDKKGRVRYRHVGPLTEKVLEEKLMPLVQMLREKR